jgi:hypothetical protein
LERQFVALERRVPGLSRWLRGLRARGARGIRIPAAILMILGGIFSFLPVFGLWMLPVGLMLLAVDLPFLRGSVAASVIRLRRRGRLLLRRLPGWRD